MERAGQVSGSVLLVGQPNKMINFIREKFPGHMEPSEHAFTIPSQSGDGQTYFQINAIQADHPIE